MHPELESLLTPVHKLNRDMMKAIRQGGGGVTDTEARFLVDTYYSMQRQRIRANNQSKGLERDAKKSGNTTEPHEGIDWTMLQFDTLESQVERILRVYVEGHPMAWFFAQTTGLGTGVLAAGLLSHIDITKAPTAGHIWRFAGYDPTQQWEAKTKRPWNAQLKTLCWKIGESFVKVSNNPSALYGHVYQERKAYEWKRNLAGANADAAAGALAAKRIGKDTDARAWYSGECSASLAAEALERGDAPTAKDCKAPDGQGTAMLPPAHIHARAKRYAVKLFLSHLQECWWEEETGTKPPAPYVIAHGGHAHYIPPPQVRLSA